MDRLGARHCGCQLVKEQLAVDQLVEERLGVRALDLRVVHEEPVGQRGGLRAARAARQGSVEVASPLDVHEMVRARLATRAAEARLDIAETASRPV